MPCFDQHHAICVVVPLILPHGPFEVRDENDHAGGTVGPALPAHEIGQSRLRFGLRIEVLVDRCKTVVDTGIAVGTWLQSLDGTNRDERIERVSSSAGRCELERQTLGVVLRPVHDTQTGEQEIGQGIQRHPERCSFPNRSTLGEVAMQTVPQLRVRQARGRIGWLWNVS